MSVDLETAAAVHPDSSPATGQPDHCPVCGSRVEEPSVPGAEGEAPCPQCGHLLWFTSKRVGDVTAVHLIDSRVAVMELLDLLDHATHDGLIGRILIDFGRIQQVSSAALGKLVKLTGHAKSVRGRLKLSGLHEDLRHVFRITHLDAFFDIYDTEAEALAAFGVAPG